MLPRQFFCYKSDHNNRTIKKFNISTSYAHTKEKNVTSGSAQCESVPGFILF